jgi:hypothetical protein
VLTPSENDKQRGPGLLAYYGPPAGAKLWFGIDKLRRLRGMESGPKGLVRSGNIQLRWQKPAQTISLTTPTESRTAKPQSNRAPKRQQIVQ